MKWWIGRNGKIGRMVKLIEGENRREIYLSYLALKFIKILTFLGKNHEYKIEKRDNQKLTYRRNRLYIELYTVYRHHWYILLVIQTRRQSIIPTDERQSLYEALLPKEAVMFIHYNRWTCVHITFRIYYHSRDTTYIIWQQTLCF